MTTSPVATADPNQPVAQRLAGARVVVTGGARGIGAEIATRLTADGARVAVLDRLVRVRNAHDDHDAHDDRDDQPALDAFEVRS